MQKLLLLCVLLSFPIILSAQNFDSLLTKGDEYYNALNYTEAINYFSQAIQADPAQLKGYWYRGDAYVGNKNYSAAIKDYSAAIQIDSTVSKFYKKRGDCYYNTNEFMLSEMDYTKVIQMDSSIALFWRYRGDCYLKMQKTESACADYQKAYELGQTFTKATAKAAGCDWAKIESFEELQANGYAQQMMGNYTEAINYFSQAIQMNPAHSEGYSNRGDVYFESKNYPNAIKDYTAAIQIDSTDGEFYLRRGDCYYNTNEFALADKDYTKGLQIDSSIASLWLCHGNANVMLGDIFEVQGSKDTDQEAKNELFAKSLQYYNEAIHAYTQLVILEPNHPDVKNNLGVVFRDRGKLLGQRMGNVEEAIASIEESLLYSIKDFESFRLLGVAYGLKGSQLEQSKRTKDAIAFHNKAISFFEKALEMSPKSVVILYNMEVAYGNLENLEKALEMNTKWKAIDPEYDPSK